LLKAELEKEMVTVLVSCGGGRKKKKQKKKICSGEREEGWFFGLFGPNCLLPQAMKSTFIYRRWKRVISYEPG
jgi:hypothetical protein